jgi:hypothetical protein
MRSLCRALVLGVGLVSVGASATAQEFDVPPRVGLTLKQVRNGRAPGCLYREHLTEAVLQAWYGDSHFQGCVVAWIGDSGGSIYGQDAFGIFVKRGPPYITRREWYPIGEPIAPFEPSPHPWALRYFSMVIDERADPIVAWAYYVRGPIHRWFLRVRRWDGRSWVDMGVVPRVGGYSTSSLEPHLDWDGEGLVLSWREFDGAFLRGSYTADWNGQEWVRRNVAVAVPP